MGPALQSSPPTAPESESRPGSPAQRVAAAVRRVPPRIRLVVGFLVLFSIAFTATVLPLFSSGSGQVRAEVAGDVPGNGVAGAPLTLDLALDNTSNAIISPLCLAVSGDAPFTVRRVVFQGLDTVAFSGGRACGGELSTGETASLLVVLVPQQAGTLHLRLVGAEGSREIGPAVYRTVTVAAR